MGSEEVVLLNLWASPYAARVRIALAEKGIDYELKEEDIFNQKSSLLEEMNPVHKQVPVLIHKGKPICESLIIVEYIDEVWNQKSTLLPSDPYQRARSRFWADFVDKKILPNGKIIWIYPDGDNKEAAKKELIENLMIMERDLGEKLYFGGEAFGFIDLATIPLHSLFYTFEKLGNFSLEAVCPKILAWTERCLQKESVSKSLGDPLKVYEYILEVTKNKG